VATRLSLPVEARFDVELWFLDGVSGLGQINDRRDSSESLHSQGQMCY